MKKILGGILLSGIVCAMTISMAFAERKSDSVKFHSDVTVNGVVVQKGTYKVAFDDKTNEFAIMKGKEIIAKANGRLEKRSKKARSTEYQTAEQNSANVLVSVTFSGNDDQIVIGELGSAGK